jgi:hypothetical protein
MNYSVVDKTKALWEIWELEELQLLLTFMKA